MNELPARDLFKCVSWTSHNLARFKLLLKQFRVYFCPTLDSKRKNVWRFFSQFFRVFHLKFQSRDKWMTSLAVEASDIEIVFIKREATLKWLERAPTKWLWLTCHRIQMKFSRKKAKSAAANHTEKTSKNLRDLVNFEVSWARRV